MKRVQFVDALPQNPNLKARLSLFSIDGIADLAENTNDIIYMSACHLHILKRTDERIHPYTYRYTYKPEGSFGLTGLLRLYEKKVETIVSPETDP
jgi:hypothetical protein